MNYLTNFYKNKAEQLQEQYNFLVQLIEGIENMTDDEIERWISQNAQNPEQAQSFRDSLKARRERARRESPSGQQSGSSREDDMRRENARRQQQGAANDARQQEETSRRRAQAERQARADEEYARRNAEAERARSAQQAEEAAKRRSGAQQTEAPKTETPSSGPKASSGPQTGAGETPRTVKDPVEEFAERVRQGYREAYQSGADEQRRRYAARDAEFDEFNRQQEARWAESDERIRADEEARKFSNRAKKAASGAWEATKTTVARETSTPTIDALGRYAQKVARDPSGTIGGAAKSAWETISSAAGYASKNPAKAAASSLKNVAKFGVLGIGPLVAGHYAGKAADTAMGKMGFERNEAEDSIKVAGEDVGIPFSDKPSARSSVSSAADWAAMNTGFQVASNLSRGAPLLAGAGSAGVAGAAAGFAAPVVAYGAYKIGEKIGEKTGFHDWLAGKIQGSPNSAGYTKLSDYPTTAELQSDTLVANWNKPDSDARQRAWAQYLLYKDQMNKD